MREPVFRSSMSEREKYSDHFVRCGSDHEGLWIVPASASDQEGGMNIHAGMQRTVYFIGAGYAVLTMRPTYWISTMASLALFWS